MISIITRWNRSYRSYMSYCFRYNCSKSKIFSSAWYWESVLLFGKARFLDRSKNRITILSSVHGRRTLQTRQTDFIFRPVCMALQWTVGETVKSIYFCAPNRLVWGRVAPDPCYDPMLPSVCTIILTNVCNLQVTAASWRNYGRQTDAVHTVTLGASIQGSIFETVHCSQLLWLIRVLNKLLIINQSIQDRPSTGLHTDFVLRSVKKR